MVTAAVMSVTMLASAAVVSAEEEAVDGSGLKIGMVVNNSGQDPYQSAYY